VTERTRGFDPRRLHRMLDVNWKDARSVMQEADQETVEVLAEMVHDAPGEGWRGGVDYDGSPSHITRDLAQEDDNNTFEVTVVRQEDGKYKADILFRMSQPNMLIESPDHEPKLTIVAAIQGAFDGFLRQIDELRAFGFGAAKKMLVIPESAVDFCVMT